MAVFWCAGMYASGSTWAFNVMRAIAAAAWPDRPEIGRFINNNDELAGLGVAGESHVLKSHDLPADATATILATGPTIVATIRDPRDAVSSLMLYQHYPFAYAISTIAASARFVAEIADRPGTLLLRYEDGFTETPDTVARIAAAMGASLDTATLTAIHARFERAAVERFIADLPNLPGAHHDPRSGDVLDPVTQWHKHHAGRTGEIGRWRRTFLPGQPAAVEAACGDVMERFGYARAPVLQQTGYTINLGSFTLKRD